MLYTEYHFPNLDTREEMQAFMIAWRDKMAELSMQFLKGEEPTASPFDLIKVVAKEL